jgi:helicase
VHLLGSERRGPTLEVTLSTLQRRAPGLQVVALSATVANPGEIADWLDAELVESDWRPVDLRTGVYDERRVRFDDETALGVDVAPGAATDPDREEPTEATVALARGAVGDGGQCLAFVRSRREAEALAARLAEAEVAAAAPGVADAVADLGATGTDERLADCCRAGVAFHHAGLRSAHRAVVESAFRDRRLAVICATPTLAAGVNVPARRVVVRDLKRYTGSGTSWLPALEVHQMCGRAGRPHLDPYGEAVLVGESGAREALWERYVHADPEAVESKLDDPAALRTHVLSVVASGFAESRRGVLDLLDATFYAHQVAAGRFAEPASLADAVDGAVADLDRMGMVEAGAGGSLSATELGAGTSRQYLTPDAGRRIADGLERAAAMETVTPLTALELVCHTPDMHTGYLGNRERAATYQFAREHADEFVTAMGEAPSFEAWLEAVGTARLLAALADGTSLEAVLSETRVGPGDLESRVERATWLLGAAGALADVQGVELPILRRLRESLSAAGPARAPGAE